ncbi:hypothetical protein DFJ58DRAFT_836857 [Suillus subalutaceus]|uniref:uncharacterized protein n=1 Tax=Suillus subalutaceus TaxID=48586 RepID=UPI001B861C94|nr:uncharacterized protein DFJ58DRAFT_836857 [Suillus subalutaceus]KAG1873041.1 hypothetical protein DFJ58DRAFT_836857 [Suillus subalutaceus]
MQLNLFFKTLKCVTKLTDKAKAALEDKLDGSFSKKRKTNMTNMSGASMAPDNAKKAKTTQPSGSTTNITPPSPPMAAHQAVVLTEEEEEAIYENAIVIDSDEIKEPRSLSPESSEVESAKDEPMHKDVKLPSIGSWIKKMHNVMHGIFSQQTFSQATKHVLRRLIQHTQWHCFKQADSTHQMALFGLQKVYKEPNFAMQ